MSLDLTFKQICDLIKKDDPKLIDAVDKLLGLGLICSPLFFGPEAAALLPTLAVKNEIVKLGKSVFDAFSKKRDDDYFAKEQRMSTAYGLLCFTAFFEALDRQISESLRKRIELLKGEKIFLAKSAQGKTSEVAAEVTDESLVSEPSSSLQAFQITFPHPTEFLAQQAARHRQLWTEMGQGFLSFIQKLAFWEAAEEEEHAQILSALTKIPEVAAECFEAQYFELARRFEDFAIWANLQEHKKTKQLLGSLSEYVKQYSTLAKDAKTSSDIGFSKLHDVILQMPETFKMSQATDIVESLKRHYNARIVEPIIEEKDVPEDGKPRLLFPRVCDAFVPQSFHALRQTGKAKPLEEESTWKDLTRRDDLGAFLLSYLSSPYSTETPLIVLGHPGSGKSLLTTVLSAQLMSSQYTAIRVPLREVDADAGIVQQIEERIRRITNISVDNWAKLSGTFKNNPPIVILDGYDELLQASGKVFSGYLKDVQYFQKTETEQGRPVRVIVTSRVTLIDKATIPQGATILRLLDFDKRQRDRWISIWNKTNVNYFKNAKIKPFAVPNDGSQGADKILSLAEQPLLLLMLALYDSEDNQLRRSKGLDRTNLYDNLLRRFVERERSKEKLFNDLPETERKKELDLEMRRLGVVAVGMYNRRKLHVLSPELNDDLKFFKLERSVPVSTGRPLSQADLLLGSFFFVHKSQAQHTAGAPAHHEETSAFEFLHNTFGEFLTADFILRQALTEVEQLKALQDSEVLRGQLEQKLSTADGFSRDWFASLVYTPLFTRPVVLEMIREWIDHTLTQKKLSKNNFLSYLDMIVLNQVKRLLVGREMPSIFRGDNAQEGFRSPFGEYPLMGHIAIYSINLILLRAIVGDEPFVFNESEIGTHEDGARPWDRLTHIWRSWFALDNLNGITAVLIANRSESQITIRPKDKFQVAESQTRLETYLNVAISLGDNISSGLTALVSADPSNHNPLDGKIVERLSAERIDLELSIMMKQLLWYESHASGENALEFLELVDRVLKQAVRRDRYGELEHVCLSIRSGLRQIAAWSLLPVDALKESVSLFRRAVDPELAFQISIRNARAGFLLYQLANEFADGEWLFEFRRNFGRIAIHRYRYLELRYDSGFRGDDLDLAWRKLARDVGAGHYAQRFQRELLDRHFRMPPLFDASQRSPEATLVMLRTILETETVDKVSHYGRDIIARMFPPERILELAEGNPVLAIGWLRLVREFGGTNEVEQYGEELVKRILRSHRIFELAEHDPKSALAWVQFVRQVGAEGKAAGYPQELVEKMLRSDRILELVEDNPEFVLDWIQLARETGSEHILDTIAQEWIERYSDRSDLSWLLEKKPLAFGIILQFVRRLGSAVSANAVLKGLLAVIHRPGGGQLVLRHLPLASLTDLKWLARTSNNAELISILPT